jgi:latrophilin 2
LKHKNLLQFGDKTGCVYWDFNNSLWSSEGCYKAVDESDRFHTVCKCNHLTNFAALMDVSGRESNDHLKSILTYCCGILSIIGLILTINLILRSKVSYDKHSRKGNLNELRSIITCNLCICLLMTNTLVLFGMDRITITVN